MKITAITDPDTALAFRLAGIEAHAVHKGQDAGRMLKKAADQKDVGIVLITEKLARAAGDIYQALTRERHLPLLLEIPDVNGTMEKRLSTAEKMASLLRR